MTSFRQIEANRRNARKSTGLVTEEGKQRSRRSAVRHGLTAETRDFREGRRTQPMSREIIYAGFGRADPVEIDRASLGTANGTQALPRLGRVCVDPAIDLARCFLRLANLPSYPLDRLSRYEAVLWRQACQILFALDALDRRKPQDRRRRFPDWERNEA
jgi:hypothetical protein